MCLNFQNNFLNTKNKRQNIQGEKCLFFVKSSKIFFSSNAFLNFTPQMRVAVFFIYLFIHLLGGGNPLYAATHHNNTPHAQSSTLAGKENATFTDTNHISIIIEDADLDEEHLSGTNVKTGGSYKYSEGKYCLQNKCYFVSSRPYVVNPFCGHFKIFLPFCGYSSPIYIRQRVLRI